jgi:hypothetical protein
MSDPEYADLRGLNGTAVAAKAALLSDKRKRSLLYFLQALSLREGGLRRIAREIIGMFPERIGTPSMHKCGTKPDQIYTADQVRKVRVELFGDDPATTEYYGRDKFPLRREWERQPAPYMHEFDRTAEAKAAIEHAKALNAQREADAKKAPLSYPAAAFVEECRERIGELEQLLAEICINPRLKFRLPDEDVEKASREERALDETFSGSDGGRFWRVQLDWFHDIAGAMLDFQRRYAEQTVENFALTRVGKLVFEGLDYAHALGKSVHIQGEAGIGKSSAVEAWCEAHLGEARFVRLSGINNRTAFFRCIAKSLGVGHTPGLSASKVQSRVEDFLQRTKIMLVIDEGQYLWPQGRRIYTHPELVNWLMTACYNERVPFAIVSTSEFTRRRQEVETQTSWRSEQLRRRIGRFVQLPDLPSSKSTKAEVDQWQPDLVLVAKQHLPGVRKHVITYLVGYAKASKGFFQAIVDAAQDAKLIAQKAGRAEVTFDDLEQAVAQWRVPSDHGLRRDFDSKPTRRRGRLQSRNGHEFETPEAALHGTFNRAAEVLPDPGRGRVESLANALS